MRSTTLEEREPVERSRPAWCVTPWPRRTKAVRDRPPGFLFMFSRNVQAVGDVSICRGRVSRPVFPNLHRVSIYTIPVALSSWRTTGGVCEKSAGRDVLRTSKPVPYHTKGRFRNRSCAHVRPPPSSLREECHLIVRRTGAHLHFTLHSPLLSKFFSVCLSSWPSSWAGL